MGEQSDHESHETEFQDETSGSSPGGHTTVDGLSVASDEFRLVPSETRFEPGVPTDWSFQVETHEGNTVTEFEDSHGELLHLIVVRRDLAHFQHLHPDIGSNGTCRVEDFTLPEPGVYRAFVDISIAGRSMTLGFDLFVHGSATFESNPEIARHAMTDEYTVERRTDDIDANEETQLSFEIHRDDERVSDLQDYLGARGHLVALREGDLAYLHIHPKNTNTQPGRVEFGTTFPTPGRYRLYLQIKPDGNLITTHFDIRIED
ncbi:hypothetical protein SAMN05421858_4925 [Haladaptatus litoreus]|uniref:Uncharacterized protein n=1 Tax=Haladaptatus litoreus TaxID=553468 RepID=A0A1N7FBY2_9EURY|nr:hypothetical protein [Haladaptatus litoreus]SIR97847.1 hypothetical protein SAMN05421858_4925 [Haladaptatus litoreus]